MTEEMIVAIDPGREKCGVAVFSLAKASVIDQGIVRRNELSDFLTACKVSYFVKTAVIGHRTTSQEICEAVEALGFVVKVINEDFSTEEARKRYWHDNKPSGWRRLLPKTLLLPPRPVDDYAAIILAERYLCTLNKLK